jgi:hypothetical protein
MNWVPLSSVPLFLFLNYCSLSELLGIFYPADYSFLHEGQLHQLKKEYLFIFKRPTEPC